MKDLGPVQKCLGINIKRDRIECTIELDQADYVSAQLITYGIDECRPTSTLMTGNMDTDSGQSQNKSFKEKDFSYQNAVGAFLFLVQATRLDLAYAVSTLSQYNTCYDEMHWSLVKKVFRYLQGTKDNKLQYSKSGSSQLQGYAGASWATNLEDSRSVTGYVFVLQGAAVCWNSRKQPTVALSSTKPEYLALSSTTQEAIWMRNFCLELYLIDPGPITVPCDNTGAIDLGKNPQFSPRTKHINIRHHFVKENIDNKEIEVNFTSTRDMMADSLTKAAVKNKLEVL